MYANKNRIDQQIYHHFHASSVEGVSICWSVALYRITHQNWRNYEHIFTALESASIIWSHHQAASEDWGLGMQWMLHQIDTNKIAYQLRKSDLISFCVKLVNKAERVLCFFVDFILFSIDFLSYIRHVHTFWRGGLGRPPLEFFSLNYPSQFCENIFEFPRGFYKVIILMLLKIFRNRNYPPPPLKSSASECMDICEKILIFDSFFQVLRNLFLVEIIFWWHSCRLVRAKGRSNFEKPIPLKV